MSGDGWSRRDLAAALAPALLGPSLLSACMTPRAPKDLISINLADTGPATPPLPDAGAQLETAFDQAKRMTVPVYLNGTRKALPPGAFFPKFTKITVIDTVHGLAMGYWI